MSNIIKYTNISNEDVKNRIIDFNENIQDEEEENSEVSVDGENDNDFKEKSIRDITKSFMEKQQELEYEKMMLEKKADEIINTATVRAETIVNEAQEKYDSIKQQAYDEGHKLGYDDGIAEGEARINEIRENLELEYNNKNILLDEKISKFELDFVELASSIIEKITGIIVDDKKEVIMHLINNALSNSPNNNTYVIRVAKEDYEFVNDKKNEIMENLKEGVSVEINIADNLTRNKCIIETDNTVIDCSLDVQLENLIEDLRLLSMSR
ncbi:MAG: hypothetical protein K6G26_01760 [Lachnospiraceae bacterium]|nr:hypothetical protein [Lachnospiraceae bacterium]